ncbi:MAG TPA: MaoC/PaaZ C-terminal domain-containing protein [Streptosporangiaceae bacterium]|nr:MaoC/PaaZ C-terminal domain-containing protein [Streptosporangiaceae bacterium]
MADAGSMKVFSLIMADSNPIHFDRHATEQLGLGSRLINQGTLNMAYPMNVVAAWIGDIRRIRSFRCRFLGSVYEDDEVVARATVTQVEGDEVTLAVSLDLADGTRLLVGSAVVDLETT